MPRKKLSDSDVEAALTTLPGWSFKGDKLFREYKFADFTHAFAFMAGAATFIQQMDHHPEWFNVYGTVRVELTTHDLGGITSMDTKLAGLLETLASKLI